MTASELLIGLAKTDLALSAGVVAVLAARVPVRRWLGARAAYGLWLVPLVAMLAVAMPARIVTVPAPSATPVTVTPAKDIAPDVGPLPVPAASLAPVPRRIDPMVALSLLWAVGVVGAAGWFARGQLRFLKAARLGIAGPAAVGVIRPKVVVPADFATRYSRAERAAILAHEAAHIALQHPRENAVAAVIQALHWFNPLVHLAAHLMRIDQELACDAAVVGERPKMRRLYAETLLKSQLSATPLPLGCYWPARTDHPLTRRVEMLNRPGASRGLQIAGAVGVAALTFAGGLGAWAAQPARVVVGPPTSMSMTLRQWWDDSDDPKDHTPAGQAAYADALARAGDLPADLAQQYAKYSRWAAEHDQDLPKLTGYALLKDARARWPTPVSDSDRSQIFLSGRLSLADGEQVTIDLPRVGFNRTTQHDDEKDGHSEIAQAKRTASGADIRLAVGLADGRTIFTPSMAFAPGETKTLALENRTSLTLMARFAGPAPQPTRVASLDIIDPPEGLQVSADRVDVREDGRLTIYTGHVQVIQGDKATLADRATIRLTEMEYRQVSKNARALYNQVLAETEAARIDFQGGRITRAALDEQERKLRHAQTDLQMTQPSAAAPEAQAPVPATARSNVHESRKIILSQTVTPATPPDKRQTMVTVTGPVDAVELKDGRAILHMHETGGRAWVLDVGSAGTFARSGLDA